MMTVVRPDLSQAIESVRLICVDTARNSNKQWIGWVMPNGDLYVEYGRVGYAQKPHLSVYHSVRAAQTKLSRLILEKQGKGYQQVAMEDAPTEQLEFSSLEASEVHVIQGRLARLQQRAAIIGQYAEITFDINRGVFTTQMGMISRQAIAQGRQALRRVEDCLFNLSGRGDRRFVTAVEAYLAIIPLRVGMTLDPDRLLGNQQQVQGQALLLDELALALSEVREIRELIRVTLEDAIGGGSDERARWSQWGESSFAETVERVGESGEDRASWSRWGEGG
jgi:predicted DNA-binding WGR domain protein